MSKIYLYNPESGAPIKNWYDGSNFWKLAVGECAAFPVDVAARLRATYGFLQELSSEEFEIRLGKLEKEEPAKIKVSPEGTLEPKSNEEIAGEKEVIEAKKKEIKTLKEKVTKAKDAEPAKGEYWELPRGALINELKKREIEVKGLGKKGITVSKEQLINLLESDDASK